MDKEEEVKSKLQRVRAWLESAELEGMVLTSQANFAWLTGGGSNYVYVGDAAGEASLLVTSSQVYLPTISSFADSWKKRSPVYLSR